MLVRALFRSSAATAGISPAVSAVPASFCSYRVFAKVPSLSLAGVTELALLSSGYKGNALPPCS